MFDTTPKVFLSTKELVLDESKPDLLYAKSCIAGFDESIELEPMVLLEGDVESYLQGVLEGQKLTTARIRAHEQLQQAQEQAQEQAPPPGEEVQADQPPPKRRMALGWMPRAMREPPTAMPARNTTFGSGTW